MRPSPRVAFIAVASLVLLCAAGCSGGQRVDGVPTVAVSAPASPAGMPAKGTSVTLTVVIPGSGAAVRRPAYISPATKSLTFDQAGGTPQTMELTSGSPNCSLGKQALTCTVDVNATPGTGETFSVKLFASTDGSGTPLSLQTIVATIVPGTANSLNFVLDGVVASITTEFTNPTLQYGQSATTSLAVNALDPSGNIIVGPGTFSDANGKAVTITLRDSDTSGATKLSQTSLTSAGSVTLAYDGAPASNLVISAKASNLTSEAKSALAIGCVQPLTSDELYEAEGTDYVSFFPARNRAGPTVTGIAGVVSDAVDSTGKVYLGGETGRPAVEQFCQGSRGMEPPYRSYVVPVPATDVARFAVAVDAKRDLFASPLSQPVIYEFAPDSGTPGAPGASTPNTPYVAAISGSKTGLFGMTSIAAGSDGRSMPETRATSPPTPPERTATSLQARPSSTPQAACSGSPP